MQFPEVQEKFQENFPENYRPWVKGWSFSKEELKETLDDGTYKLLTLDISINDDNYVQIVNNGRDGTFTERAEKNYNCDIGCAHCFECKTHTDNPLMTTEEVFEMLIQAKELGLKSVKFLGPGELMHNPKLFEILDFLKANDIHICIFTKGLILGDDNYAQKTFGMTSSELCTKIEEYGNVSILLSLTSADRDTENKRINSKKVPNLFEMRNKAFENLCAANMNGDPESQRLALLCTPVLNDNVDEALEIYKWAITRNIPVVIAPTMISGKGLEMAEVKDSYFKEGKLTELYADIYTWLVKKNIFTVAQIEEDGISSYPGFACNQVIGGMFVRKDGRVQICPGNESDELIYDPDVRKTSVKKVWKNCLGYKLRTKLVESGEMKLTQPCYAKTERINFPEIGEVVKKGEGSIPENFYEEILTRVKKACESEVSIDNVDK